MVLLIIHWCLCLISLFVIQILASVISFIMFPNYALYASITAGLLFMVGITFLYTGLKRPICPSCNLYLGGGTSVNPIVPTVKPNKPAETKVKNAVKTKPSQRFCSKCGESLLENQVFCSYCGSKE